MTEPLSVAGLETAARDATGLTDFGPDTGWREGFERLAAAVEAMGPNDQLRQLATQSGAMVQRTKNSFVLQVM